VAFGEGAVEWSVRYLPDFRLPDKALDVVDQA
jgi:ATP-dependent Clp protease ATP-binding subunit ClpA